MIHFFRDILSGPLYIITSMLSLFLIMAIIGYIMEKKKLESEYNAKVAVIDNNQDKSMINVAPISPVSIAEDNNMQQSLNNFQPSNNELEVKEPVIVFEDPDQRKE